VLDALRALGGSGTPDEVVERVAQIENASDEIQNELLSSGEPRFPNQVHWARFYLKREGYLDGSKRGVWSLTENGRATHLSPQEARELFLKWVRKDQELRRAKSNVASPVTESAAPPAIEQVSETGDPPQDGYRAELIGLILNLPPAGFERAGSTHTARSWLR
jgi:restriction system protein